MAVTTPYRITPNLGPDLYQTGVDYYWDEISTPDVPSYQLGSKVIGNDGHEYVHVVAGSSNIAADATVSVDEETWVATAGGAGGWTTVRAVLAGEACHVRRVAL